MCSCGNSVKIPTVITNINTDAVVEYGSQKYKCNITRLTDGVISVTINSPQNLSGLTFRCVDGKYSVSYDELLCKTDSVFLPETSFPTVIIQILSSVSNRDNLLYQSVNDDKFIFSGNTPLGSFNIETNSDGKITSITQKNTNLKISMSDNKPEN